MPAADGAFDHPSEELSTTIDVSGFGGGLSTLSIRARDLAGNWGPTATVTLTVTEAPRPPARSAGSGPTPDSGAGATRGTPSGSPAAPRASVLGSRTLRLGMRGPDVSRLQRILRGRGLAVTVSGAFGPKTRNAVRLMQRRLRLRLTGVADARFLYRLGIRTQGRGATPPR